MKPKGCSDQVGDLSGRREIDGKMKGKSVKK